VKSTSTYPDKPQMRDDWIVRQRGLRNEVDHSRPVTFLVEQEHLSNGEIGSIATIFLTNRECPWRCVMCDLWKNTSAETVPVGAIPQQIDYALSHLPAARQVKLYNSGSFFDPRAIPLRDYPAIASLVRHFERVIIESHPALIHHGCLEFNRLLGTQLEVAMGLETAHPTVLEQLNKRMSLDQYHAAADFLQNNGIDLRSFILVQPPFMKPEDSLHWACRSIDFAASCQATAISLIPTRGGNGAMEQIALEGDFLPPELAVIEDAQDYGLALQKGRIFVDEWDLDRIAVASCCRVDRLQRIRQVNLSQHKVVRVECGHTI
jgi:radical SAM enzyme (TIGR01210 family)